MKDGLGIVTFFKTSHGDIEVGFLDYAYCTIDEFRKILEKLREDKKFSISSYNKHTEITDMAEKFLNNYEDLEESNN